MKIENFQEHTITVEITPRLNLAVAEKLQGMAGTNIEEAVKSTEAVLTKGRLEDGLTLSSPLS